MEDIRFLLEEQARLKAIKQFIGPTVLHRNIILDFWPECSSRMFGDR